MVTFIEDFGILLMIIVIISFIAMFMKQAIIVGYVLAGLLFSFILRDSSSSGVQISILSELGLMFILFLIGLGFNVKSLKYLGKRIMGAALVQSIIFFVIMLTVSLFWGYNFIESAYIGAIFMFSSTLLVGKWLDDKNESITAQGKITLGILLLQDLFAVIALTFLSAFHEKTITKILFVPFGAIILILTAFLFAKFLLRRLLMFASNYPELLFIFSLGVCFLFVQISVLLGYSPTIGAFIAGLTLATTIYKSDIEGRLKPLNTFFTMLFFVGLGFQVNLNISLRALGFIALISISTLILKPIIAYISLRREGYDMKTSFIAGLNLAQLSEFGLIIVASGIAREGISSEIGAITIISTIVTMVLSSYMIKNDIAIFRFMEKHMGKMDDAIPKKELDEQKPLPDYNVLFFGYYQIAKDMFAKIDGLGKKLLVIENHPDNIEALKRDGIPYVYNSVTNPYFFRKFNFKKVDLVVSSLMDIDENKIIIQNVKQNNPSAVLIVTAKDVRNSLDLYDFGADYVIYPSYINEQQVSVLIEDYTTDINKVITKKINDITKLKELKKRKDTYSTGFDINKFLERMSKKNHSLARAEKTNESLSPAGKLLENKAEPKKADDNSVSSQRNTAIADAIRATENVLNNQSTVNSLLSLPTSKSPSLAPASSQPCA